MINNLFLSKKEKVVFLLFIMLCLLSLLCFSSSLFASEPDSGFLGLVPGINGDTRHGISYGGVFVLGVDLNEQFSTGFKTSFFDNLDTVSAHETALFLRYYFPLSKNVKGPFVQLEGGGVVFFERGYHEYPEAFPAFSGGLSAGWRFNLGNYWYIEPAGRVGYPHIWGASITAGIRFKAQSKNQKTIIVEQQNETDEQVIAQIENTDAQTENNVEQIDNNVNKINTNVNQPENRIIVRERFSEVH